MLKKPENMTMKELLDAREQCQHVIEYQRIRFMELGMQLEKVRAILSLDEQRKEIEAQMEVLEPGKKELEKKLKLWDKIKGLFFNG